MSVTQPNADGDDGTPGSHPVRLARAASRTASCASALALGQWAQHAVGELVRLIPDASLTVAPFQAAGARVGGMWAACFGRRVFALAVWTGLLFASGIGAIVWAFGLPVRHSTAIVTAGAYALIASVSLAAIRSEMAQFAALLQKIAWSVSRPSAPGRRSSLAAYTTIMPMLAAAYVGLTEYRIRRTSQQHTLLFSLGNEFTAFLLVTAVGLLIAYTLLAFSYADALAPSGRRETMIWPAALLITVFAAPVGRARIRVAANTVPRLDTAALTLLDCAVRIARTGASADPEGSGAHDDVRSMIAALELAARDMERYAVDRVPWSDFTTRRAAVQGGALLASVVRGAKAPLARAVHGDDYIGVARSLIKVLVAWSDEHGGGIADLVRGLPPIDRPALWRRISGRIWNAAILAAAGVVLPVLPAYANQHAAAAGARYALFTAAVFSLATGKVGAWDAVNSTLDKMPDTTSTPGA